MISEEVTEIKIVKEIPLFGSGDTLENRLRNVTLRGFKDIKIYEHAQFETIFLTPEQIKTQLHTPQPNVYTDNLKRVEKLRTLFKEKGIDILNLEKAYDFIARAENGEETEWTMIPPIIEEWTIPKSASGKFNYEPLLSEALKRELTSQGLGINPELERLPYSSESGIFNLVNDGIHRVHHGFMNEGIKIIKVKGITPGYPYYAAPQPYSSVKIMPEPSPETTAMKVHIITEPGQKTLYRLFPSGGIKSGEVRPPTAGETFI